jgi:hypothetical protein
LYVDFGVESRDVIAGETVCWELGPANFGFVSSTCTESDTFCMEAYDTEGWVITGDPQLWACMILDPGYVWWQDICVTVPGGVEIGDTDTITAIMSYCNASNICRPDCGDCEDPNWQSGEPYYYMDTIVLHVVESPPMLEILQDSLTLVWGEQSAAYVSFTICNMDPYSIPRVYDYSIMNRGHVGAGFPQGGSTDPVAGGECEEVFGIVDATFSNECDMDTLTIVAWDSETGTVYDTCVQIIHVVFPLPVSLFTAPVVAVLVLVIMLTSAVIMKKHIIGKNRA